MVKAVLIDVSLGEELLQFFLVQFHLWFLSLFPLFSHAGLHKSLKHQLFIDEPVDVGLEQDLWPFLQSELLMLLKHLPPEILLFVIRLLEDIGKIKILQDLIVSEVGGQAGIPSLPHVHLLPEVVEAAKAATPKAFLF